MRAIDTNVLVRVLTRDDPDQAARARAVVEPGEVFVSATVLLETEWVLRSAYGMRIDAILAALRAFAGLPQVKLDDPERIAAALDWATEGMDFADALHLAAAAGRCDVFFSFDQRLAKAAKGLEAPEVLAP